MGDLISNSSALVLSKYQLSVSVPTLPLFPIITFIVYLILNYKLLWIDYVILS